MHETIDEIVKSDMKRSLNKVLACVKQELAGYDSDTEQDEADEEEEPEEPQSPPPYEPSSPCFLPESPVYE